MSWRNIRLILVRELRDQLRDRRTLFMITVLPVLLYPMLGLGIVEMMLTFSEQPRTGRPAGRRTTSSRH
jgi:sodium transport system permease protein